jgi:microcin C transport system substrate-binding protein
LDQLIDRYRASSDMAEITELSHRMQEMLHKDGCWIPAWKRPWFRIGYWRWVGWPEGFNVMKARSAAEWNLHWIDTALKEETLSAQREGRTFEPQILLFDQFKEN